MHETILLLFFSLHLAGARKLAREALGFLFGGRARTHCAFAPSALTRMHNTHG
jgi:hypothetical protein